MDSANEIELGLDLESCMVQKYSFVFASSTQQTPRPSTAIPCCHQLTDLCHFRISSSYVGTCLLTLDLLKCLLYHLYNLFS